MKVGAPISKLAIGHTLPAGATVAKALLDGKPVTPADARRPTAGSRSRSPTGAGTHTLVVTTG